MESDDLEEGEIKEGEDGEVDNNNARSKSKRRSSRVDSARNQQGHRSRAGVRKSRYDQDRKIPSRSHSKRKSPARKTSNHRRKSVEEESRRKESQNIIRSLHGKHKSAQKRHVESTQGDSSQPNIFISVTNDQKKPKIVNAQSSESKENKNRKGISFSISKKKTSVIKSLPTKVQEKNNNTNDESNRSKESSKNKPAPTYISLFPDSQIEDISDNDDDDDNASIISVEAPPKPLPEIVTIDSSDGEHEEEKTTTVSQVDQEEDDDVEVLHLRRVALQDLMSKLHRNVNLEKEKETTTTSNRDENQNANTPNDYDHDDIGIRSMDEDDDDDDVNDNPILLGDDQPYSPYSSSPYDEDDVTRKIQSIHALSKEEEQIMFAKAREQWNLINSIKSSGINETHHRNLQQQHGQQQQQYEGSFSSSDSSNISSYTSYTNNNNDNMLVTSNNTSIDPTSIATTTTTSATLMPEHVLKEQNYHQEYGRMTGLKSSDKENTFSNEDILCSKLISQSFLPTPPSIEPFEFLRPYSTVDSSASSTAVTSSLTITPTVTNNNNNDSSNMISTNANDYKDFLGTLYVPNLGTRDIDMRFPNYSGNPANNILPSSLHIPSNFTQEYQQQLQQQLLNSMSQPMFFNTNGLLNQSGTNPYTTTALLQQQQQQQQQQQNTTATGGIFDYQNLIGTSIMNPTTTGHITNLISTTPITTTCPTAITTTSNLGMQLSSSNLVPPSSMYANNFFNPSFLNMMSWPTYSLNVNPYLSANNDINTEALLLRSSAFQLPNTTLTPPPIPDEPILTTPPPLPPISPPSSPIKPEEKSKKRPRPPPPPIIRNFAKSSENNEDSIQNTSSIITNTDKDTSLEQSTEKSVVVDVDTLKISDNSISSSEESHYVRYDEPPSSPEVTLISTTINNSLPIISETLSPKLTSVISELSSTTTTTTDQSKSLIKSTIESTIKPTSVSTTTTTTIPQTTSTITSAPSKVIDNFTSTTSVPIAATTTTTNTDASPAKSNACNTITTTTVSNSAGPIPTTQSSSSIQKVNQENVDDGDDMNSFEDEEILRAQLLLEISRKKKDPIIIPISTTIPSSSIAIAKKLPSPIKPPYAVTSGNTNLKAKTIITATSSNSSNIIPMKTTKQFSKLQLPVLQNIYSKDNRIQPYTKNNLININNRTPSQLQPVINKKSKNLQFVRVVNNGAGNINRTTNKSASINNLATTSATKVNNTSINNNIPTTTTTRSSPSLHNIQRTIINNNAVKKNSYNPNADTLMKHLKITVPNQNVTPLIIRVGQDESSSDDDYDANDVEMNETHHEKTKRLEQIIEDRGKKSLTVSNTYPILNIPKVQASVISSSTSSSSALIQSSPATETTSTTTTALPKSFEASLDNLLRTSREHSKHIAASSLLPPPPPTKTTTNNSNPLLPSFFEIDEEEVNNDDNIISSLSTSSSSLISNSVDSNVMPTTITSTISLSNSNVNENQENIFSMCPVNNEEGISAESAPVVDAIKQREELCLRERLLKATLLKKMNDQKDKIELRKMEGSIVQSRRAINKELNTLLSEMVKISDIKRELKDQQEKVDRMRKELLRAENKLMLTAETCMSKEANRKSLTSRVFSMRKECVQLLKQCREQGMKIEGTNYKVPNTESLEMRSKLAEVRNQNLVFRNTSKNSPRKSLTLTSTPISLKRCNNNMYTSATLVAANRVKKFIMNRSRVGKRTPYSTNNFRSRINSVSSGIHKLIKPSTPQQIARISRRLHDKKLMGSSSGSSKNTKYRWLTKHGEYGDNYENGIEEDNDDGDEDQDVFLLPRILFKDVMMQKEEKESEFNTWVPYQSPLNSIRSLDGHSGVGRQIDPFITLCYFELRSACNSEKCHFQHLYRPSSQSISK